MEAEDWINLLLMDGPWIAMVWSLTRQKSYLNLWNRMCPYKLNYSTTSTLNTLNSTTALQDGRPILEQAEDNNPITWSYTCIACNFTKV